MNRQSLWIWFLLLGLLVLLGPGRAGHLLLDLIGGLTLTVLLLPLFAAGAAFVGWQLLRSRLRTCPSCGLTSLGAAQCPACGASFSASGDSMAANRQDPQSGGMDGAPALDARDVTIDVVARSVDE